MSSTAACSKLPFSFASCLKVTQIIMKTTGECLSAETIEAGGKTHTAFVFIKPHANNEKAAAAAAELAWLYTLDVFFGGGVLIQQPILLDSGNFLNFQSSLFEIETTSLLDLCRKRLP